MLKFLLWNLNKKPLQDSVARLARMHDIDVIVLIENTQPPDLIQRTLNLPGTGDYYYSPGQCKKVQIFCRFLHGFIKPIFEDHRLTIRHLTLPARMDILLAAVHFCGKPHYEDHDQTSLCTTLSIKIKEAEKKVSHQRTVLTGDLNMNPFSPGILSAMGLHAITSGKIAQERRMRNVQYEEYPFFYNPMWNLFGDKTPGPAGTYYYDNGKPIVQFWHMYDQVLLRPDLISSFKDENLKILETDGHESFLSKSGIPDSRNYSDHLPVLFGLDI